jgi:glutathione S-transferase
MSLTLFIGNKNYSSSSMRAGVLLRAFEIDVYERFIRFDSFAPGSALKRQVAEFSPAGSVPFLVDDTVTDASGKPLVIWDTLAIIEYLADRFTDLPIWPEDTALRARARSLCAEMHCGFSALRNHCIMNIGVDLSRQGRILWRDQPTLRRDIARIENACEEIMLWSKGPYLAGNFGAIDAFFAPVIMRLKYYDLPVSETLKRYIDIHCAHPAVAEWITSAIDTAEFIDFEEPYRLSTEI